MSPVHRLPIVHPSAWTVKDVGGKDGLRVSLSQEQLDAVDELLARTRGRRPQEVTRGEFDHPALTPFLAGIRDIIMHGRGAVIISGLTRERYSEEDFERIYWGFGTHWGDAAVQSANGDRLGYVRKEEADPTARGYRGQSELSFHTDSYEIVGLMCVQSAESGGLSSLVSALSIHNEILRARPELLAPLYEGYHYAIPELQFTEKPVTDEKIPVFCNVDGQVSCMYAGSFMRAAAEKRGVPLPYDLTEALDLFAATSRREELALQFLLEPGEMLIWHNFLNLHARTAFENSARKQRLLLRLWLSVPGGRPVDPRILRRAEAYDGVWRERMKRAGSLA